MPLQYNPQEKEKAFAAARRVKLLVLDLDGVLTDGGLYYDPTGQILKRFNVHDGFGIKVAMGMGIETAIITGLRSMSSRARAERLGIKYYVEGEESKLAPLEEIRTACGLEWDEVAYVGDDWVDLLPMRKVGFPAAVCNAQPEVLDAALYVTRLAGGNGAVREVIRFILTAQDKMDEAMARWEECL